VTIHFVLRGMGVAPAGSARANSGHHHLLIDTDLPPLDAAQTAEPRIDDRHQTHPNADKNDQSWYCKEMATGRRGRLPRLRHVAKRKIEGGSICLASSSS